MNPINEKDGAANGPSFFDFFFSQQQAVLSSTVQQHSDFVRFSVELITAAAQPTPGTTDTASVGQFCAQAPHSMQASR